VPPHLPDDPADLHNGAMRIAWYAARATWRSCWRTALAVALIGGLLGTVALGALAGARRTDSAYSRYLRSVNASDVLVDVPGPVLPVIREVEHEPGALSTAAWLGLNGEPVIDGKVDDSFLADAIDGSLDGEFYRLDKLTVLAGRLPPPSATNEIVLTPSMASLFHLTVGDHMTWAFSQNVLVNGVPTNASRPAGRATFLVAAIADRAPALADQFDDVASAIAPPGVTARYLNQEFGWGWVAMRLRGGDAGVPALERRLASLSASLTAHYKFPVTLTIRRMDVVKDEAQQAIEPQAIALAMLGGLAALAMLVLVGQGLAQLLSRSAADAPALRAMGASQADAAVVAGAPGVAAVLVAVLLSVGGAITLSPLAPVGPVRRFDPVRGVQADWLVLGAGGAALLVLLTSLAAVLAWRAVRPVRQLPPARPAAVTTAARRGGLPVAAVVGIQHAAETGSGRLRTPVRATLTGSVVAVTALVAALVFGASLTGLVTHPSRYGWNWTLMIQAEGGWGDWAPATMDKLVSDQPGVTGWSEFGFGQLAIRGTEVPVMGLFRHAGVRAVEPPTTSGHPLTGPDQIELGTVTMRQLGLSIGDRVRIGTGSYGRELTVVGTVTLPSFGVSLTDHVSLGRGAMMEEGTLLAVQGFPPDDAAGPTAASTSYPSSAAIDVSSRADARALAARIIAADPAEVPGSMYQLGPQLGAPVVNASQMGSLPLALAIGVAAAAVLALGLTILASVRRRRRDLALLKALGLRPRQVRAVIAWQTSTILAVATIVGVPLGIAGGQWAWTTFATAIGVVPFTVVPTASLLAGVAALFVAGNLLASGPAQIAARIAPAATFRAE
jgi:hypothetical protein